ncbi:MAG: SDR family NAD(P)-dependent oxidoreductase [Clostridia bacterium]|nr:SDR family NAD(P)-dependent oxidoreductase [Clostridia bacterium]
MVTTKTKGTKTRVAQKSTQKTKPLQKPVAQTYLPEKRVIVLTGVTSGMGLEVLYKLAKTDCVIMLIGRDPAVCKAALENMPRDQTKADISVVLGDLSVMSQVRIIANEVMSRLKDRGIKHIDVIYHNATQHPNEIQHTYERHEIQWATNYLAVFMLNHLFLPFLNKSNSARIITTTTQPTQKQKLDYAEIQNSRDPRRMFEYSKLADLMYAMQFNEEFRDTNICAYCVYPGIAHTHSKRRGIFGLIDKIKDRKALPMLQAVETVLYLITAPHLPPKVMLYHNYRPLMPSEYALNPFNRRRLWRATCAILGIENRE